MDAKEIAALTPYSAQREEIRKELRNFKVKGVPVKTITDSQGTFSLSEINKGFKKSLVLFLRERVWDSAAVHSPFQSERGYYNWRWSEDEGRLWLD